MIVHLDYEARSKVDLTSVGGHRYAIDPSTEIFMAAVSDDVPDSPVYLWVNPKFETPDVLSDPRAEQLLAKATIIYAHNAPFEQAVTWGAFKNLVASPFVVEPPLNVWRCSAAISRRAGLPSSLDKCAEALGLVQQKDSAGKKLIKLFCIPQKDGTFVDPAIHPEEWFAFGEYCKQDVRVEKAIHAKLKAFELTGALLEAFQFDLRLNQLGIPVNVVALKNAQNIIHEVEAKVAKEFVALTGFQPTQREKVRVLVGLPDMQATTVDAALLDPLLDVSTEHILSLYQKLSYAAVKKVHTMLDCVCPDGRVRGGHLFYGAGTGRWSGRLIQPQNFKKPEKEMRPLVDAAYQQICDGADADTLDLLYGEPFRVMASLIRQFIHQPGTEMIDGDYNAIEARVLPWLAGQHDLVEMWRKGVDLYKFMASEIYGVPVDQVDADQRGLGKMAILGLGYGMGADKFRDSCKIMAGLEISEELAEKSKTLYRQTYDKIVAYWYFLDRSARAAIAQPDTQQGPFTVRRVAGLDYLLFRLKSGRSLAYPHPRIEKQVGDVRDQISYWGQLPGTVVWGRVKLYGGKLAENETQATAADIMAHGAINAEKLGMPPFALIHDQGLALRDKGQTAEQFSAALADLPAWAKGLPLKAESKIVPYYKK